mmetsp:Transcript_20936/g.40558  ORF Transcript_20936/g.40558 Transcript_20936/m.40558 type:complete len:219 (-) Transcript_20936:200-856(-)
MTLNRHSRLTWKTSRWGFFSASRIFSRYRRKLETKSSRRGSSSERKKEKTDIKLAGVTTIPRLTQANEARYGNHDNLFNYEGWVRDYIDEAKRPRDLNGRKVFYPLGGSELRAVSRFLHVQFQVMSKRTVLETCGGLLLDEIDPRVVGPRQMHIFNKKSPRIVRLLNIDENHYRVHLPRPKDTTPGGIVLKRDEAFNDMQFWAAKPGSGFDPDSLPEL